MSRPKKPIGTHLAITAIRMPPQVKVKLEALSAQTGLAQQEHIRRALDAYFYDLESKGQFDPLSRPAPGRTRRGRIPAAAPPSGPSFTKRRIFRRPGSAGASA